MTTNWIELAARVAAGRPVSREEALAMLRASEDELLAMLQGAFELRRRAFGRRVDLHVIENARGGLCSEDCAYCSQSAVSSADVPVHETRDPATMLEHARAAAACGAVRFCIVASGREPDPNELDRVCAAVERIKRELDLQICTSLGLLDDAAARRLAAAGVDRYNHNLETSERFFPQICSTHTWQERRETIARAKAAGMEVCCGGLVGMGETDEDRVDLALAIREVGADSIPVNFLDPRPGTPLAGRERLSPVTCLKVLAMFRYVCPDREIRCAGGREACLRSLQPLALWAANSIFTQGYLTTPGQGWERDRAMIAEAGFEIGHWVKA
ncbi:MAG: biotin synthase BioB [Kiritimatiellae bacterium]|nr:biotin synthase BioB [Kiritimatiellia bacterium]